MTENKKVYDLEKQDNISKKKFHNVQLVEHCKMFLQYWTLLC